MCGEGFWVISSGRSFSFWVTFVVLWGPILVAVPGAGGAKWIVVGGYSVGSGGASGFFFDAMVFVFVPGGLGRHGPDSVLADRGGARAVLMRSGERRARGIDWAARSAAKPGPR